MGGFMNDKFFKLPLEKQQRILNAAYKVFSENSYKKAPMSEIAEEGGISKALLFHYFHNKKELYLYLWTQAVEMTRETISKYNIFESSNFFQVLKRTVQAKCSLMKTYPRLYAFSLRAYYEMNEEVKTSVQESYSIISRMSEQTLWKKIDRTLLRNDISLELMYKEIFYAVDGYMLDKYRSNQIDAEIIEYELMNMIDFWEKIYTKAER